MTQPNDKSFGPSLPWLIAVVFAISVALSLLLLGLLAARAEPVQCPFTVEADGTWQPCPQWAMRPGETRVEFWVRWGAMLAPAEYDHPFPGKLDIVRMSVEDVLRRCPPQPVPIGCVPKITPSHCIVFLVDADVIEATGLPYQVIWRHEVQHCNNWPADHRGQRRLTAEEIRSLVLYPNVPLVPWVEMPPKKLRDMTIQELIDHPGRSHNLNVVR